MKTYAKQIIIFIMIMMPYFEVLAQVTTGANNGLGSDFVGWDGTMTPGLPLLIEHQATDGLIEFWTSGNYRARIGNSGEFSLIVGDGATPLYNNIDVATSGYPAPVSEGYRYGTEIILSAPNYENLICGLGAGTNTTGSNNTMVGTYAGNTNVDGWFNTFLGNSAGINSLSANANTFLGANSGNGNVSGLNNTFAGFESGFANQEDENTFIGFQAGRENTTNN